MSQDAFMMLLRISLQMAGTFLLAKNVFTPTDWTALVGSIMTAAPIVWSFWVRREAGLKSTVGALPNTVVVTTAPLAMPALDTKQTTALAAKIATLSEVKSVISTPEVAAATVSDKVVSGTNTAPATS